MYQQFGARELGDTRTARFRLFIPDNALDPGQYTAGKSPNITAVHVVGDVQSSLGRTDWAVDPLFEMKKSKFTDPEDGPPRTVCDPCTWYGGATDQNSAFVIGGPKMNAVPLASTKPLDQLVLYELMEATSQQ